MKPQSDPAGSQRSLSLHKGGSLHNTEEQRSGERGDLKERMINTFYGPLFFDLCNSIGEQYYCRLLLAWDRNINDKRECIKLSLRRYALCQTAARCVDYIPHDAELYATNDSS